MFKEKQVPDNQLKEVITELLEWCDHQEEEGELGKTFFNDGLSEKPITEWEQKNDITIPESYKDWLHFSGKCVINSTTARFFAPEDFRFEYVPDGYVVIGEMIGDGEVVCFSKESGEFIGYFEGRISYRYSEFGSVLKDIIELMGKRKPADKQETIDALKRMKVLLESKLNGSDSDEVYLRKIERVDASINKLESN